MATSASNERLPEIQEARGLAAWYKRLYERADLRSRGSLSFVHQSITRFIDMRGTESSASMAYYALFSMFPLALFLVSILGYILDSESAYRYAVLVIRNIFPFADVVLNQNLRTIIALRGTVGLIGVLGTLWSSSSYFNILANGINRAWPMVKLRSYVHNRLVALAMIAALFLLLAFSLISTALLNLLPMLMLDEGGTFQNSVIWQTLLSLLPAVFTFIMFVALYRWVPNKDVSWKAVLPGAALVTLAWELAKAGFAMYLRSGLGNYQFVYGSLGALIALMVWIYLSNLISLFGAYLVAGLDQRFEPVQEKLVPEAAAEVGQAKGIRG